MASLEDIKEIQAVIPKLRCNSSRGQLGDVHQDLLFLQTLVDPKPWPATEDFKRIEYKIDQIRKLTEELIQTPSQNAVAEGLLLLRSLAYSAGVRSELEWRNCPEYKRPGGKFLQVANESIYLY
jgi:hypothetical protein